MLFIRLPESKVYRQKTAVKLRRLCKLLEEADQETVLASEPSGSVVAHGETPMTAILHQQTRLTTFCGQ
ncbi:MAG: hypothetical protein AAFO04_19955 [Cyanobacteria bacterium J06592_8]